MPPAQPHRRQILHNQMKERLQQARPRLEVSSWEGASVRTVSTFGFKGGEPDQGNRLSQMITAERRCGRDPERQLQV